jgi:hypothetical protein
MDTKINSKNWEKVASEMVKGTRTATSSERFSLSADYLVWANKKQTSGIYQKGNVICVVRDFAPHFYTKMEAKKAPVTAPTAEEIKARQDAYKAEVEARKPQVVETKKIETPVSKPATRIQRETEVDSIVREMEMGTFESQSSNYLTPVEKEAKRVFEARKAARQAKEDGARADESDTDRFVRMCELVINRFDAAQKAHGYSYCGVDGNAKHAFEIMFKMFPV